MDRLQASERAPQTRGRTIHRASLYDTLTGLLFLGKEGAFREMTLELAQVESGDKVLDVGCGPGRLTIAARVWTGPAGEVHGIDAAPEMIGVAHQKAAQMGVDVDFQVGLIEDIPFPDDQFDVVLSSLMLHHLPEDLKRRGFVEIHRVLKPGGRFLAVDFELLTRPLIRGLATAFFGHGMMQSYAQELAAMMEDAGFREIEEGMTRYRLFSFLRGRARKELSVPNSSAP